MKLLGRFAGDRRGAIAVIFGLALFPMLLAAGAVVDYSRATQVRTALQKGVDATALQLAQRARDLSDGALRERGRQLFADVVGERVQLDLSQLTISREGDAVQVAATANVQNVFMRLAGIHITPVSAEGIATSGRKTIELALVLDNTGSMSRFNRMTELITASQNLLEALNRAVTDDETVRVSIIPFDVRVRADANANRNADWLRFASESDRANWRGFIDDRDQPYHTNATNPDRARSETLYPASNVRENLATMMPLTSVRSGYRALRAKIDSMRPAGCTNITIGAAWGLASLTPGGPLPGARPAETDGLEKIMILLTDGDNTRSRYAVGSSCNGAVSSQIDPTTASACESARRAGVTVYTVRLSEGNANLLRGCASRGSDGMPLYYDVREASELNGVFQSIVNQILATRLTH